MSLLRRRRRDVEIRLELPALASLFVVPDLDPFSPEYEAYGDRPGVEVIAGSLKAESLKSRFRVVLQLPAREVEPGVEERAAEAVRRYARVRVADLERDIHEVTRHGIRALLVGLLAVLLLNALARPLERSDDSLLQLFAEGLQVTSWVILWVPIGLLVYDRWYYSRDRKVYARMEELEWSVVAQR